MIGFYLVLLITLSTFSKHDGLLLQQFNKQMNSKSLPPIDLRSDTVTKPSENMRKLMFEAEVGDDVFCEDPTVNALEQRVAKMFGKEQALFFPTGTMANLAAVMTWCSSRGSEMILGDKSHIHIYEQGGVSQFGGVATHIIPNNLDGTLTLDFVEAAIRADNIHFPTTELIAVENTHNFVGGRILPSGYLEELAAIAGRREVPIHLDGARIWNAAAATQEPLDKLVASVDSLTACLSKGLGAPAGSLFIGKSSTIAKARRIRKALGGGMRQAGVLAAAGWQAIDDFESGMLVHDHQRAKLLAEILSKVPGLYVDPVDVETNIIVIRLLTEELSKCTASQFLEQLRERGVLALPRSGSAIRLVLHRDISDDDVLRAANIIRETAARFWAGVYRSQNESTAIAAGKGTDSSAQSHAHAAAVTVEAEISPLPDTSSSSSNPPTNSGVGQDPSGVLATNVSLGAYEEASIYGMSVSPDGFCVFLQGLISERIVKIHVTPIDPMVDGLDREQVESSEAVTLLQLLQGIDVETYLPKEAISAKFGERCRLRRVMIQGVGMRDAFSAKLVGNSRRANVSDIIINEEGAAPLIDVTKPSQPFSAALGDQHSLMLPIQKPSEEARLIDNPVVSYILQTALNYTKAPSLFVKEVEIKNAFEAIALALRHKAAIEIRSDLFNDESLSYSVDEVRAEYPLLLESSGNGASEEEHLDRIVAEPIYAQRTMERLQRQLFEATRQRKEEKAMVIADKIKSVLKLIFSKVSPNQPTPPADSDATDVNKTTSSINM